MASPIDPTPTLTGDDAERLLRDLEKGCSDEEYEGRVRAAKQHLATVLVDDGDALYRDPRDPPGVMRVARTGRIVQQAEGLDLRTDPTPPWAED